MHGLTGALQASQVKIAAAEAHLDRLDQARDRVLEENLKVAELVGETNSQRTKYLFRVKDMIDLPKLEWGVILGDAVHCLRSAMDQVVYGLARAKTAETGFPICRTERDWIIKAPAKYWSVHPGVVALIDRVQPYHYGDAHANHPLALLAALSNLDKHRTIPTVALVADDTEATVEATQGIAKWNTIRFIKGRTYEPSTVVAECKIVPDNSGLEPDMDVKITANFDVGFGTIPEARWLDGRPVVPTFNTILGGYIVREFFNPLVTIWNEVAEGIVKRASTEKG